LPLPKTIYAHGWWTANGAKISKRAGNVINPYDIIDKYGLDPFRFFLFKENVFGRDGDFSEPALIMRFNSELVNDLSNLLNRTISMTKKYIGNVVPSKLENPPETEIQDKTASVLAEYHKRMERLEFREALCAIFELTDAGNKYVDTKAPWTLMKEGRMDELNHVLYSLLESLRVVSIMLNSFMPETARRIQAQLGVVNFDVSFSATEKWGGLISGSALGETKHLFSRIPQEVYDEAVKRQKEILDRIAALEKEELEKMQNQNKSENAPAETVAEAKPAEDAAHAPEARPETKEEIDYDLFSKVDLRLAKVIAAEKVPKADKLLKLTVDAGDGEPRTIVAGIAAVYTPEQMVGRRIVVVANLKPRKLKGIESKGMLLAASDHSTGKLAVVTLKDGEDMPAGTKVS